jgi:hypothetical protein
MMVIFHWETFLAQSWQAYELLRHFFDPKTKIFKKNDGSVEERLFRLYNKTKHSEGTIRARNLPKNATIPLWLTNNGLRSKDTQLSYVETTEILKDLAKWAQILQDPLTIVEKLRKDGLTTG